MKQKNKKIGYQNQRVENNKPTKQKKMGVKTNFLKKYNLEKRVEMVTTGLRDLVVEVEGGGTRRKKARWGG